MAVISEPPKSPKEFLTTDELAETEFLTTDELAEKDFLTTDELAEKEFMTTDELAAQSQLPVAESFKFEKSAPKPQSYEHAAILWGYLHYILMNLLCELVCKSDDVKVNLFNTHNLIRARDYLVELLRIINGHLRYSGLVTFHSLKDAHVRSNKEKFVWVRLGNGQVHYGVLLEDGDF